MLSIRSMTTVEARAGVRALSSLLPDLSGEQILSQKTRIGTYKYQPALPRLPIPRLEQTCSRYLASVQPLVSPEQFEKTQKITENFLMGVGNDLNKALIAHDSANRHSSYISEMWFDMYLRDRRTVVFNHNPFMRWWNDPQNPGQIERATSLIMSSLRFYQTLKQEKLDPEVFHTKPEKSKGVLYETLTNMLPAKLAYVLAYSRGAYPLDMSQYPNLFGTTRVPHPVKDEIRHFADSNHIVVLWRGQFYHVNVRNEDGSNKSAAEVHSRLKGIMLSQPANVHTEEEFPVGLLTSLDRTTWAGLREDLIANKMNEESLHLIDSALFVVCLDDVPSAFSLTPEGMKGNAQDAKLFLHSDGINRWWDKSFSLIVSANGAAGVNFEHSWGDGVAVLRYMTEVFDDALARGAIAQGTDAIPADPLAFHLSDKVKRAIKDANQQFQKKAGSLGLEFVKFGAFGKDFLKSSKISPDGTLQMAIQLGHWKLKGKLVSTYESASTAAFKHGRTETIRSCTNEAVAFVQAMANKRTDREELLRAAVHKHFELSKNAAMGQGHDRHLFALKYISERQSSTLPDFYADPSYSTMSTSIISTSTLVGSAICSGGFGPVVPEGYGVGYGMVDDGCVLNVTNYNNEAGDFAAAIVESLHDIYGVLKR